jgi:hypothetical protein
VKYNTLSEHDDVFEVPEMMTDDVPLWIGITSLGIESDRSVGGYRERFAFTFATGPLDDDIQYQGDDIRGPAIGSVTEAEIAATLMGFAYAYGEGDLTDSLDGDDIKLEFDGDVVATGETAVFLHANAERFGIVGSELEEGYIAYNDTSWNDTLDLYVRRAFPTGKEPE